MLKICFLHQLIVLCVDAAMRLCYEHDFHKLESITKLYIRMFV